MGSSRRLGVIGVGAIAQAIVDGLSGDGAPDVVLSPRGAAVSADLAQRHPNVTVAPDNQGVVDASDVLLITVRPDDVAAVLDALTVPGDRLVVSAVAGWTLAALREHLPEQPRLVRTIPMPAVSERRGVTAIYPADPVVEELFTSLGEPVVVESEDVFAAFSAVTATVSSYLAYLDVIAGWLGRHGLDAPGADQFVRGLFHGVGTALDDHDTTLSDLVGDHETPAGLNEQVRRTWFDPNRAELEAALDEVLRRVTGTDAS